MGRMRAVATNLAHAWNLWTSSDYTRERPLGDTSMYGGVSFGRRPDRPLPSYSNERSIVSAIYTRLAIDVASVDIRHVRRDDQDRYKEDMSSGLQNILQVEANLDQGPTMFKRDVVSTLIEQGIVVIVPVDTDVNPETGAYEIVTVRVGEIKAWYKDHVRVNVYNENRGLREDVVIAKKACAIVENPFYSVMNEPNSTLKRLVAKLNMLDAVDKQSSSGKLDLILQLPYQVKSQKRREGAEQRRRDLEAQLANSQYGVAWSDGTEKVIQLNRPVENNLMEQVKYLTDELYGELGLTKNVMLGTASEEEMLNYWNRTIEPILEAIVEEMRRKFLTKTARAQKQWILYFRDVFKLIPLGGENGLAKAIDILARNEVMSSNELREPLGLRPRPEAHADELRNSNMPNPAADQANNAIDSTAEDVDIAGLLSEFGGSEVDSAAA